MRPPRFTVVRDWPGARPFPARRRADAIRAVALERIADDRAPPLPAGTYVRGGAQLFDSQSACPFQAFARFRLRADAWAPCPDGLSAAERGIVLHAMLKAFWDDVRDHATLVISLSRRLAATDRRRVTAGKTKLPPARWRALPPAVADAESHRLAATMLHGSSSTSCRGRRFVAQANEQAIETDVEGVAVNVRIDRIDALASGGLAIVDYKSGRVVQPPRWFAARPEGIQLAVYAHAVERSGGRPCARLPSRSQGRRHRSQGLAEGPTRGRPRYRGRVAACRRATGRMRGRSCAASLRCWRAKSATASRASRHDARQLASTAACSRYAASGLLDDGVPADDASDE